MLECSKEKFMAIDVYKKKVFKEILISNSFMLKHLMLSLEKKKFNCFKILLNFSINQYIEINQSINILIQSVTVVTKFARQFEFQ